MTERPGKCMNKIILLSNMALACCRINSRCCARRHRWFTLKISMRFCKKKKKPKNPAPNTFFFNSHFKLYTFSYTVLRRNICKKSFTNMGRKRFKLSISISTKGSWALNLQCFPSYSLCLVENTIVRELQIQCELNVGQHLTGRERQLIPLCKRAKL